MFRLPVMRCRSFAPCALVLALSWSVCLPAGAELPPEQGEVLVLDPSPAPGWVWVTDISFPNFVPGKAHLVDAAAGRHLGMITMGYGLTALGLPRHGREFYSVESHYDRTYRGNRFDFVGVYNARTLELEAEIEIPPKKISSVPFLSYVALTDDDRFLLIDNFTPAQSVSIVDMENRRFAGEVQTAGCGLVFAAGARRFLSLCGDGTVFDVTFSETGEIVAAGHSARIFDPSVEFITEKAVRHGTTWLFVTNTGEIQPIDFSGKRLAAASRWPLFGDEERGEGWRIGGQQHLALHAASGRLYAVVHQGEEDSHKEAGSRVIVHDVSTGRRIAAIELQQPASAIQVTQEPAALLLTTNAYPPVLDVYDAASGKHLRSIGDVAVTPMTLQTPVH